MKSVQQWVSELMGDRPSNDGKDFKALRADRPHKKCHACDPHRFCQKCGGSIHQQYYCVDCEDVWPRS